MPGPVFVRPSLLVAAAEDAGFIIGIDGGETGVEEVVNAAVYWPLTRLG